MKRVYLHPLPLRIWHWTNALILVLLLITGFQIRMPGMAAIGPQDPALLVHRWAGWAMAVSWTFWLLYSLAGGHLRRHYRFRKGDFAGAFGQARFYLISIFRGEENPFRPTAEAKFNPLQKLAYGTIMGIFTPLLMVTGILFSDVPFLRTYVLSWNLAGIINALHVIGAYVFVLYLMVHLYMATLGPTFLAHTTAMITGFEEEEPDGPEEVIVRPGPEAAVVPQEIQKV